MNQNSPALCLGLFQTGIFRVQTAKVLIRTVSTDNAVFAYTCGLFLLAVAYIFDLLAEKMHKF